MYKRSLEIVFRIFFPTYFLHLSCLRLPFFHQPSLQLFPFLFHPPFPFLPSLLFFRLLFPFLPPSSLPSLLFLPSFPLPFSPLPSQAHGLGVHTAEEIEQFGK